MADNTGDEEKAAAPSRPPPLSAAAAARAAAASGDDRGKAPAANNGSNNNGNVRSLSDLRRSEEAGRGRGAAGGGGPSSSDEDDDDGANEYYVGGDKSGQVVKGAPKDKRNKEGFPSDPEALFDAARAAGARAGTAADLGVGGVGGVGGAFAGVGRTLAGGGGGGGAVGGDASAPGAAGAGVAGEGPKPITHVIAFYENGFFTVDGGPGRQMSDPANAEFLDAIGAGRCPPELEPPPPSSSGASPVPVPISVNLVRKHEDYVKPSYVAFAGEARTLSGSAGGGGGGGGGGRGAPAPASDDKGKAPTGSSPPPSGPATWSGVDESKPSTSVQVRLRDGTRLVARFNLRHTVGDVRAFISAARAGERDSPSGYSLSTGFPPRMLEDDSATLEEAGLENAVVVQK